MTTLLSTLSTKTYTILAQEFGEEGFGETGAYGESSFGAGEFGTGAGASPGALPNTGPEWILLGVGIVAVVAAVTIFLRLRHKEKALEF